MDARGASITNVFPPPYGGRKMHGNLRIQRRADLIDRMDATTAVHFKEAEGGHHEPRTHLALVFVAQIKVIGSVAVIPIEDRLTHF